jgi:glycine betaine/choline ABC-type transport system substrate-binding protein
VFHGHPPGEAAPRKAQDKERKSMKNRVLAALLCAALTMTMLAGCGAKDTAEDTAEEIMSTETVTDVTADTEEEADTAEAKTTVTPAAEKGTIIVSRYGEFAIESNVLGELYALALEDNGYPVKREYGYGLKGLQIGKADVILQFTGYAVEDALEGDPLTDKQEIYDYVSKEYEDRWNIKWLALTGIEDKTIVVMKKDRAQELGITCLSDLQAQAADLRAFEIGDVLESDRNRMDEYYGTFDFAQIDSGLDSANELKECLDEGLCDVGFAYDNASYLFDDDYLILEEDIPVFQTQYVAPVVREDTLAMYPDVEDILNSVSAKVTTENLREMLTVDRNGKEYTEVVAEFYEAHCK